MTAALVGLLAGYLIGSVSPATLVARRRGADLRASGSGNPGATNVGRVLGRRTGVLVGVLDVLKGLLPAVLFGLWEPAAGLAAGFAAVLGHVSSPFLRGHGGKGVATAAGALLGTHLFWAVPVGVTWVVVLFATRWVALASVCAAVVLPLVALAVSAPGRDIVWAVAVALVVLVRHRANFRRWWVARHPSTDPPAASSGEGSAP